jgi:hypothetical protein
VHEEGFGVEIADAGSGPVGRVIGGYGNVRFKWPDGRCFPDVPASSKLPDAPVAALKSKHSRLGIRVGPETTTPLWNGEPFDPGWAIYVMRSSPDLEASPTSSRPYVI